MDMEKEKGVSSAAYESKGSGKLSSLTPLSGNLEKLVLHAEFDYSDIEIVVEGISVGVNSCILASRSPYFHELFKKTNVFFANESKPKYVMEELLPHGKIGYEAFMVFLYYVYTGNIKPFPPNVSICVDESCAHDACGPAINFAVELMYASATFEMKELVLNVQRHLLTSIDLAFVEDVIPIVLVAFHCQLNQLLSHCIQKLARSDLDDLTLDKELPLEVLTDIKSFLKQSNQDLEDAVVEVNFIYEKIIRSIHKALDSDDVELLKLLLEEYHITLDDAYALHYAVAYCSTEVVNEVLNMGNADINLTDSRGYTALHKAARRKDPSIIVALLSKGASVSDCTNDGQTSIRICKRLTRPKDYYESTKEGQEANKDRLCICILEREMLSHPIAGSMSISSVMMEDDLVPRLLFLENRVAFARILFPREARIAVGMAQADSKPYFTGFLASKPSCGYLGVVDLNETPDKRVRRLQLRLQTLRQTVVTGRRFFPNCSLVLDGFLEEEDMQETDLLLGSRTQDEQSAKKMRFLKLKAEMMEAFDKDKCELNRCSLAFSFGSSFRKTSININGRKRKTTSSLDDQMSIAVGRRVTQPMDCNETTNPILGGICLSSMLAADDVVMRLLLLENMVSVARALFTSEVKMSLEIADSDSSGAFSASTALCGDLKMVDLNENPSDQEKRLQAWLQALQKTVEKCGRFYPRCCEVLRRFLENGLEDIRIKEMRFMEIKEEVIKAFETDKAGIQPTDVSSSSSESDTVLLERARKLLRGNNGTGRGQAMGLEQAMMIFNNVDKDENSETCSSSSSSRSISSVNQAVGGRPLY